MPQPLRYRVPSASASQSLPSSWAVPSPLSRVLNVTDRVKEAGFLTC
jgi:hypothetical protein